MDSIVKGFDFGDCCFYVGYYLLLLLSVAFDRLVVGRSLKEWGEAVRYEW